MTVILGEVEHCHNLRQQNVLPGFSTDKCTPAYAYRQLGWAFIHFLSEKWPDNSPPAKSSPHRDIRCDRMRSDRMYLPSQTKEYKPIAKWILHIKRKKSIFKHNWFSASFILAVSKCYIFPSALFWHFSTMVCKKCFCITANIKVVYLWII